MQCTKPKVHHLRPLPPSTFQSREIVECRINGKSFRPMAIDSASMGSCIYRPWYGGKAGYIFDLTANMHESLCVFSSITIYLDSVELRQGKFYTLGTPGVKKNYASYFFVRGCGQVGKRVYTSNDLRAEVFITRIDTVKKVVLGTFDIRMKDSTGNFYRFSDGFFDRHFRN